MSPAAPKMLAKGLTAPASATPAHVVKVNPEGVVTAIVAVTGVVDGVGDLIVPGAFAWSLSQRRPKVVDDHEWKNKVGRVLHSEEWMPGDPRLPKRTKDGKPWPKEAGALVASMQYNLRSERGRDSFEWVRFYAESNEAEFSIGYRVPEGKSRERRDGVRVILLVDLFEYSHVLFGAAPLSMALQVKSLHAGSAGSVTLPALTELSPDKKKATDEEAESYDDVRTPNPERPWDDLFKKKPRAGMQCKTAASALLEAKSLGNAENLRKWFVAGADGAIPWGSDGDFDACVVVASKHMSVEDAKGYCNLRHKEATTMYPATHAALEGKAYSRMKGSFEERIAGLNEAAEGLIRTELGLDGDDAMSGSMSCMNVATYANEGVWKVWVGNDELAFLIPYTVPEDGSYELGEPQRVELSLVANTVDDGEPYQGQPDDYDDADPEDVLVVEPLARQMAAGETLMDQMQTKTADRIRARVRQLRLESKSAEQVQADADTITADNLPDDGWSEFRKTQPIQAMTMDHDFTVETREGVVRGKAGDSLAIDSEGYPYPIAADEMAAVYEPTDGSAPAAGDEANEDPAEEATETPAAEAAEPEADNAEGSAEEEATEAPEQEAAETDDGSEGPEGSPQEEATETPEEEAAEPKDDEPVPADPAAADTGTVTVNPDDHYKMLDSLETDDA